MKMIIAITPRKGGSQGKNEIRFQEGGEGGSVIEVGVAGLALPQSKASSGGRDPVAEALSCKRTPKTIDNRDGDIYVSHTKGE